MAKTHVFLRRKGRTIPFGYKIYEHDKQLLEPIGDELDALEQAKKLIKQGCSYRDTAAWLTTVTGRYLSHVGLFKRIKNERSLRRRAVTTAETENRAA